jgi:hypothetical protein
MPLPELLGILLQRFWSRSVAPPTILGVRDNRTDPTLLGVGGLLEVLGRPDVEVHLYAELVGVGAHMRREPQFGGHSRRLISGAIDPSLPVAALVHENELRVVQADPNDHCFHPRPLPAEEVFGAMERLSRLSLALKGPCARHDAAAYPARRTPYVRL